MSSGPLPASITTCWDGSPRTSNLSALSSKLKDVSKEEEDGLNVPASTVPSRPRTTQTTKSSLETRQDSILVQQASEDKITKSQSDADSPISRIIETKNLTNENKIFSQPSNSDNSNTNLNSNRSRAVEMTRQQCTCFPYIKYLRCGKNL